SRRAVKADAAAATFEGDYAPEGAPLAPPPGSLEHFLTERYCLYTLDRSSRPCSLEIHHPPWPLQTAGANISMNTMAAASGIDLPPLPPLLHFSKRQDVVIWPLRRL